MCDIYRETGSDNRLEMLYDANGTKLQKKVYANNALTQTKDYVNGWEYTDGELEAIYNAYGRNHNTNVGTGNATQVMRYEYNITDHLGNVRLTYTDKDNDGVIEQSNDPAVSEVLQETHYYPFGMAMKGSWINDAGSLGNQYLYNGKELNTDFGLDMLDYWFRWYDPSIGRWHSPDLLAEGRVWANPYNFVQNNPILRVDPDGLTDYVYNNETGELSQYGDDNDDETDQILKTNSNGEVKRKGDGLFGFLVKKSERGKAKVGVKNIAKGILKNGMNFKEKSNPIDINGDDQPSLDDVKEFAYDFAAHINQEIGGTAYSDDKTGNVTLAIIGGFGDDNSDTHVSNTGRGLGDRTPGVSLAQQFHTHLSMAGVNNIDKATESSDIATKNDILRTMPNVKFYLLLRENKSPGKEY